ncbi:hypothetical protein C8R42DRAFT_641328 [Lentinula raphanica]|nr:hypothetical protein C8R42DRAFT_641328 [Lentinula raphanica]
MVFLLPLRCLVTSLLLIPLLGFIRPVLPQKVVMAADPPYNKDVSTMYLWDPHWRNVRRPYDDNSIWLVFSKWNSTSGCQENKAVRPFRSGSSVSTDTETGAWEYDTMPAPVLNKEGTWARIGQWADETQSWDKALTIQYKTRLNPIVSGNGLYGHTRAQPEELDWSFYDVRAHLKGTLTKWTSSGKMKSTDEEKVVWVKFLQQGTGMHHGLPGGNFLGIPRLAPYPDRITYYIWKAPVLLGSQLSWSTICLVGDAMTSLWTGSMSTSNSLPPIQIFVETRQLDSVVNFLSFSDSIAISTARFLAQLQTSLPLFSRLVLRLVNL